VLLALFYQICRLIIWFIDCPLSKIFTLYICAAKLRVSFFWYCMKISPCGVIFLKIDQSYRMKPDWKMAASSYCSISSAARMITTLMWYRSPQTLTRNLMVAGMGSVLHKSTAFIPTAWVSPQCPMLTNTRKINRKSSPQFQSFFSRLCADSYDIASYKNRTQHRSWPRGRKVLARAIPFDL